MPEIIAEQRSTEWFTAREGKITGSVAGAILGVSPYMSASSVLEDMIKRHQGYDVKFPENPAMAHGVFHEAYAIADLEMEMDLQVRECGLFVHSALPWLAASPDGLVGDSGVAEIKCPYYIRRDNPPKFKALQDMPHYYAQIQLEMACTDRTFCIFYQWTPHGSYAEIVQIDNKWLDENLPKLHSFYQRYLAERDKPLDRFDDLAEQYQDAKNKVDDAKTVMESIRLEMIMATDGNKTKMGKFTVQEVTRKGPVKYSDVIKKHLPALDLDPFRGAPSTAWTIK